MLVNRGITVTTDSIKKAVAAVKNERPAYKTLLDFYEGLFLAQEEIKRKIQLDPPEIAPDLVSIKRKEGFPLATPETFHIDADASQGLLRELCSLVPETNGLLLDACTRLIDALDRDVLDISDIFQPVLSGNDERLTEVAEKAKVDKVPLIFLAYNAIRPSLCLYAEQLSTYLADNKTWSKGYCPVCGTLPAVAILKDEGNRFMVCGFCAHEWAVPRLFCPFCENQDQKQLRYFFSNDEKGLRVDVCDRCKKYIKTIDVRELKRPLYPFLEHVASLHLDMLAQEKGLESGLPLWLQM